ncbi:MAG: DUF4180 domain-containing protein [Clostridiales bacterium]|nr:DUF4180 domain-containing protein [Clostridiales bacterium]
MNKTAIQKNGHAIADIMSGEPLNTDVQSALDLLMTARRELGADRILLNKACVCEDFFILSTGLAGEILQKCINYGYGTKLGVYGDYSRYTSKPLHDFLYESNQGEDFFFTKAREEALQKLSNTR